MLNRTMGLLQSDFGVLGTAEVPIYLVRSREGWILIEAGIAALASTVLQQLDTIVGDRHAVVAWIVTHSHYDHCGLLPSLAPLLPNAQIFASERAAAAFRSPTSQAVIVRLNNELLSTQRLEAGAAGSLEVQQRTSYQDLDVTTFADGARLDFGASCTFDIVAAPGHSACQVALFQSSHGRAFVSDALGDLSAPGCWCPLAFDNVFEYRRSIQKIAALGATEICLAHHYRLSADAARGAPSEALQAIDQFAEEAARFRREAGGESAVAAALSLRYRGATAGFVSEELHIRSMRRLLVLLTEETRHGTRAD